MSSLRDRAAANPLIRFAYRARVLGQEFESVRARPRDSARFLVRGREVSNFTYEVENMAEMARFVAEVTGSSEAEADSAIAELAGDEPLLRDLRATLAANPRREAIPLLGYRRAAHAITRLSKPKSVFEVGTHDGLGSAAIAAALEANSAERAPGVLHTFDINPDAGWLIPARVDEHVQMHAGEITDTLPPLLSADRPEFVFQDVGHAFEHAEFVFSKALEATRGHRLYLMSEVDTESHLPRLCEREGEPYFAFTERPHRHFWHGHTWGVGVFGG